MEPSRIALVIIGQEILNGKVADTNSAYVIRRLHELGAVLGTITIIPDDIDMIAETVKALSKRYDFVITSGGIGPTHDDVTMAGVAKGLGQELIRHPYLKTLVGRFHKVADLTAAQLRLAEVPANAQLIVHSSEEYPQIYVDNIYMLPGIPQLFEQRFEDLIDKFQVITTYQDSITVKGMETEFTAVLNRAVRLHPKVTFGSYPKLIDGEQDAYLVKITLDSNSAEELSKAKEFLLSNIPACVELIEK